MPTLTQIGLVAGGSALLSDLTVQQQTGLLLGGSVRRPQASMKQQRRSEQPTYCESAHQCCPSLSSIFRMTVAMVAASTLAFFLANNGTCT